MAEILINFMVYTLLWQLAIIERVFIVKKISVFKWRRLEIIIMS